MKKLTALLLIFFICTINISAEEIHAWEFAKKPTTLKTQPFDPENTQLKKYSNKLKKVVHKKRKLIEFQNQKTPYFECDKTNNPWTITFHRYIDKKTEKFQIYDKTLEDKLIEIRDGLVFLCPPLMIILGKPPYF